MRVIWALSAVVLVILLDLAVKRDRIDFNNQVEIHDCGGVLVEIVVGPTTTKWDLEQACLVDGL